MEGWKVGLWLRFVVFDLYFFIRSRAVENMKRVLIYSS